MVTTAFLCIATTAPIGCSLLKNKRRDQMILEMVHTENSEFFGLAGRDNPEFRVTRSCAKSIL